MKGIFTLFLLAATLQPLYGQSEKDRFVLTQDERWRTELFDFPLSFAPEVDYEGYEDIRFLKGWSNQESDEFWSYAFVWVLKDEPVITAASLARDMNYYFDGLMKLPGQAAMEGTEAASIKASESVFDKDNDSKYSFYGTIKTKEAFFTQKVITLNVKVEQSYCGQSDQYFVLFRLSPLDFSASIWDQLSEVKVVCE